MGCFHKAYGNFSRGVLYCNFADQGCYRETIYSLLGSDRIYSHPKGDFLHWIFHGSSTSPKVLTASITRSHPKSSPLSARRCVWKREPECSTSAAVRGRCCAPGHAITESSAPAST